MSFDTEKKPLIHLGQGDYDADDMTIFANRAGLIALQKMISEVLENKKVTPLTIKRGKREKHRVVISKSVHEDFPSCYD